MRLRHATATDHHCARWPGLSAITTMAEKCVRGTLQVSIIQRARIREYLGDSLLATIDVAFNDGVRPFAAPKMLPVPAYLAPRQAHRPRSPALSHGFHS